MGFIKETHQIHLPGRYYGKSMVNNPLIKAFFVMVGTEKPWGAPVVNWP